jgi:hypothetical protein
MEASGVQEIFTNWGPDRAETNVISRLGVCQGKMGRYFFAPRTMHGLLIEDGGDGLFFCRSRT